MSDPGPPALARLLLRLLLPDPPGRELRADLDEEYGQRVRPERGRWSADLWYWRQALASLAPLWRRRLETRGWRWWGGGGGIAGWRADLRGAFRRLRRDPAFAGLVVLTLAVGIGANTAIFSVVQGVLLRPLPYPDADRLVHLWETNPEVGDELHGPSPLNFADWERSAGGFEAMAAWYLTSGTYRTEAWAEELRSARVTADFFRVLGVRPMLGRDFRREEVLRYGPVMLSHRVWRRLFGGDPSVVGTTIVSSGNAYEIVGVMPPGFAYPDESVETWVAWDLPTVYADRPEARTWRFLEALGRLAPGTSAARAEEELDAVAASLAEAHPEADGGWDVALTSL
ncbi:MAG: hypothetical protein GWM92_15365, partial [Gemmatimonadetes bacterium]|nr:hypothetical protein [Gemmatimonadota bacterium]NIR80982.1 hypothetical protein [Gemmatimonadota bacterium]NIT88870.1 hypothetical protein [Gemmatimonadota bacterium]NIU32670.1 hypothetical protein [Gemmatimonadota bacterium]NIU37110.1 hypothetical protein [Gemmatimonadota bacterium]